MKNNIVKARIPKCVRKAKIDLSVLYIIIFAVSLLQFLTALYVTGGNMISNWYFYDYRDTGMDFFHSIEYIKDRRPYELFDTLYPPLANLFFLGIYGVMPKWLTDNWTLDFSQSVQARGTNLDLRTYQAPMMSYFVFLMIVSVAVVELTQWAMREKQGTVRKLLSFCMLLSYGMLYSAERGNIIMMGWCFLLFFLICYDGENPLLREWALVSLAIAAGLKLYPALYGLLLLNRKDVTRALRAIIYGILSLILPCLAFREGLFGLRKWFEIVTAYGKGSYHIWGISCSNILCNYNRFLERHSRPTIGQAYFPAVTYTVVLLSLAAALLLHDRWEKILAITLAVVLYSSQGEYIYTFWAIALLFLLREETFLNVHNAVPFIGMTMLTVNSPLFFKLLQENRHNTISQNVVAILFLWVMCRTVLQIVQRVRKKTMGELKSEY